MPQQQPQAEPSMEEILASIRRIISEEESAAPAGGDVLDLTQTAADEADSDDLLVFEAEPAPKPAPAPPVAAEPARAAAPAPRPAPQPAPPAATGESGDDAIVSTPVSNAASSSLTKLQGALRIAEAPGQTLEGVVRQMLTPLLREWLDQNLPAIVEAKVEAELERIARMSR